MWKNEILFNSITLHNELNIPLGDILFTSSIRIDACQTNTAHVIGVGDITAIPHLFRLTKRRDWLKQDEDSLWKVLITLKQTLICMHWISFPTRIIVTQCEQQIDL